jgi:hypothetical protein
MAKGERLQARFQEREQAPRLNHAYARATVTEIGTADLQLLTVACADDEHLPTVGRRAISQDKER